jgi:hypothetical protein
LAVPSVLGRTFSLNGRVATVLLTGERGFACLETISGFATRLVPISAPAETSADFGCVFLMGMPSLIVGARFGRVEGSGFCVVLGLSAWVIMPGSRGFEVFGANAIVVGKSVVRLPGSADKCRDCKNYSERKRQAIT